MRSIAETHSGIESEQFDPTRLPQEAKSSKPKSARRYWAGVLFIQTSIVVAVLAAWEYLPKIHALSSRTHLLDPFFISSPSMVAHRLGELIWGDQSTTPLLSYAWNTISSALLGLVLGMLAGILVGMLLGSVKFLSDIFRPFIIFLNTIPKVAIIPIILLLCGPTFKGTLLTAVMTVFIVTFFNAYAGAQSVQPHLIQNATLLGAKRHHVMFRVRFPYVVAWTVSILPLAATYSIIMVVTAEILIGVPGLGRLISNATTAADATLTFSLVVILALVGSITVGVASLITRRYLHWWAK
jgi:NitT/TauT family transport system permease protein